MKKYVQPEVELVDLVTEAIAMGVSRGEEEEGM